jgi:anti-sigma regulatory factor (Ser/Thr protein kinase)
VSFPGTLDSLSPIATFILELAAELGLDEHATYRLRLAVDEVAHNIILHGYAEAGLTGRIDLSVCLVEGSLIIEAEDTGAPYHLTEECLPTKEALERPLEERALGGLGLLLVTQSVDALHHVCLGKKNQTVLVLHRGQVEHRGEH